MLASLEESARTLMLTLTEGYRWVRPHDEHSMFFTAWRKFLKIVHGSSHIKKIAILPLKKRRTRGPKSADSIYYLARRYEHPMRVALSPCRLVFCRDTADFARHASVSTALLLVDDYIGSGETAITCIRGIQSLRAGMPRFVLSLVAQQTGIEELAKSDCTVVCCEAPGRGIADNAALSDKPTAYAVMRKLETKLSIGSKYRLGWRATEALITLARTPNNTFPVFWTLRKINSTPWKAPFPRTSPYESSRE